MIAFHPILTWGTDGDAPLPGGGGTSAYWARTLSVRAPRFRAGHTFTLVEPGQNEDDDR